MQHIGPNGIAGTTPVEPYVRISGVEKLCIGGDGKPAGHSNVVARPSLQAEARRTRLRAAIPWHVRRRIHGRYPDPTLDEEPLALGIPTRHEAQ